jgi:hypothetical protein
MRSWKSRCPDCWLLSEAALLYIFNEDDIPRSKTSAAIEFFIKAEGEIEFENVSVISDHFFGVGVVKSKLALEPFLYTLLETKLSLAKIRSPSLIIL